MANLYFWTKTNQKLNLYTDASGAIGFGALFGREWCYGKWPENWLKYNIAVLEFLFVGSFNQWVLVFTDNQSLVSVIKKQTSKDAELTSFFHTIVRVCLQNNILFKAKHVAGRHNVLADRLSQFKVDQFPQLAPVHMHRFPKSIPSYLPPANLQL